MKLIKYFVIPILAIGVLFSFTSCNNDGDNLSRKVLASANSLFFDVEGGIQLITIYSDADWIMSDYPDWLTVSPDKGTCTTDVTITVGDNYLDGAPNNPRSTTLVFKGGIYDSEAYVEIQQEGDKYRNVLDYTVDQIYDVDDNIVVSVPNAVVVTLGSDGFIISNTDFLSFVYVTCDEEVEVGDIVNLMGDKSTLFDLPIIEAETCEIVSTGYSVTYPTPKDITDEFNTYKSSTWEYVSIQGNLKTTSVLEIRSSTYDVNIINDIDSELIGHKVTLTGFYAGMSAPYMRLIVNVTQDDGSMYIYYLVEDFEWMAPWSAVNNAPDPVGDHNEDTTNNVRTQTTIYNGVSCHDELVSRGYRFDTIAMDDTGVSGEYYSVYVSRNYLKFGMTSRSAGIILPPFNQDPDAGNVHVSFDWSPMAYSDIPDDTQLRMTISGGGMNREILIPELEWDTWRWYNVDIELEDITVTEDTEIKIWNIAAQWAVLGSAYRWFIDNISVYSEY